VAVDGSSGKLLWYRQVVRHDLRDYDLGLARARHDSRRGAPTEVAFAAGKMGRVCAFAAADGHPVRERPVETHSNDTRPPVGERSTLVVPGALGGVETSMAYDGGSLYVPVVNLGVSVHVEHHQARKPGRSLRRHGKAHGAAIEPRKAWEAGGRSRPPAVQPGERRIVRSLVRPEDAALVPHLLSSPYEWF
jgi:hypothetical protein